MASEDDESIPEEQMDEIVTRVVEQLRGTPAEPSDIEVHDGQESRDDDTEGRASGDDPEGARERAERRREEARERKREAKRRAREARSGGLDDLGERIEAAVETQLEGVAESIEHSLGATAPEPSDPPTAGVTIGPGDTSEKAIYKTQLQKGGRVAVPDAEMDALGLEPGDTLQVVLYPV